MTLRIGVHVYPQGDRWYAASTDFVLMAEGATEQEAWERFCTQAMAYIRTALAHGWLDALNRRPTLVRRLEIRRRFWTAKLLHRHPTHTTQQLRLA